MTTDETRERPAGVPEAAWWSPKDDEWVFADKDSEGRHHGEVHYWRPDGTLCCVTQYRHGTPHGSYRRVHETGEIAQIGTFDDGKLHGRRQIFAATGHTTEKMHAGGLSREVVRSEYEYVHGLFISLRHFGADGTELATDGTPLPPRPEGVPARAFYNVKSSRWLVGTWNEKGGREGPLEVFGSDGRRTAIETYRDSIAHGPTTLFHPDGSTKSSILEYANGKLNGVSEQYYRDGRLARRAHFQADEWSGPLSDWSQSGELIAEVTVGAPAAANAPAEPCQLAQEIAIGWGGDEDRDVVAARAARRAVRELKDPELVDALRATGLDTAPRLLTATRLDRVIAAMSKVSAVDVDALVTELSARGGVGLTAALGRDGPSAVARAVAALRSRVDDKKLTLTWQGLRRLPRAIRYLPWLYEIDASNNQIDEIPPEIAESFLLRRLELNSNRIATLPNELARLRDLYALHLADNNLTTAPEILCELTGLTVLNLGNNEIERLPDDFGQLDRLHTLWLYDNPLADLPPSFAQLSSLSFLHLGDAPWTTPPPVIYELPSLRELWIASRSLSVLPPDIAGLPKLERLHVWYSNLSEIPDVLFEMTSLKELRISNNPLPDGTIDRLKEALPDCTIY